ncbi:hypothetical protein O6H91_10G062000 [Diphasiastrum complanatum]|uniref:Uncharacterized protein n=3 Tax=Diphasiastrum complanatum TaxID=34168 RepID=A0ACC2CHL2_DIPCM|nr:hypothetical protein O6H91_Y363300 [Diphasiastrum complanatum]KAJ7281228.1 hypothetical protein O6H91_Y363300 [Diphasiastrum complanatum]KAJ7541488.1 hypothetical protein O6H91_10G062000 [Diphasiastrum complanatum]KAJ7541489.1 hypothetical protein O6H91_10G062000 [Diphasiastrum complanatum]KAJ7541490.1 hypothetical protein O6H91_10G062000 [Diphasiastrum complanatum]
MPRSSAKRGASFSRILGWLGRVSRLYKDPRKEIPPDLNSGGGLSCENIGLAFSYGYSSLCGRRTTMEDFFDARICSVDGLLVGLFGIFDGHGGSRAASYVKENLFKTLLKHPMFVTDTSHGIAEAYKQTDLEYLASSADDQLSDDGSTALIAVLVGDKLIIANLGDCRAVLSKAGEAVPLSSDHKPVRLDERMRIEEAGGVVQWEAGCWRVGGILAVSRAFGNRRLKEFVSADPEIQELVIKEDVDFLVIASDGLWDLIQNQDAINLVKSIADAEAAAIRLAEEAFRRGSIDNITCIVVRFHHDRQSSSMQ